MRLNLKLDQISSYNQGDPPTVPRMPCNINSSWTNSQQTSTLSLDHTTIQGSKSKIHYLIWNNHRVPFYQLLESEVQADPTLTP